MSKTRLNSNMSDELYNMKKFATTVIATDVKENKEKVFITITNTPNEYHNYYSDDWITSPLYEAYNVEEKLFTKNIEFSNEFINKLSDCFLKNVTPEFLINRELKKDGQFDRTFEKFFKQLFYELRNTKNDDFKNGKIPNNEIEFLQLIKDVLNHRIEILTENK